MKTVHSISETCEILGCPQNSFLYYRKNGWVFPPKKSVPKAVLIWYADTDIPKLKKIIKKLRANPGHPKKRMFGAKEANTYYH